MGYFYEFRQIYGSKKQISLEIEFYDATYKNSKPIFAAARKNIFGKVVTLHVEDKKTKPCTKQTVTLLSHKNIRNAEDDLWYRLSLL